MTVGPSESCLHILKVTNVCGSLSLQGYYSATELVKARPTGGLRCILKEGLQLRRKDPRVVRGGTGVANCMWIAGIGPERVCKLLLCPTGP